MNSIKPIKKEKEFKINELKLPFKRKDTLKGSNLNSAELSEQGDDDGNSDSDTNRSDVSKVNSNRDTIIVPQFKYVATDANDVIEQNLPFLCFNEIDNENINIYGIDLGGYSIAISHYCSKNKNIINFNNSGRNSLYIEKYGLKTEIFLPQLVLTDILGMSVTEVKDIIKSFYTFPGCEVDAMESDVYRLQLFMQKSDPVIVYSIEQLYFLLLYKIKEMIISNSLNYTEPVNVLFSIPSYYSVNQKTIITQLCHSLRINIKSFVQNHICCALYYGMRYNSEFIRLEKQKEEEEREKEAKEEREEKKRREEKKEKEEKSEEKEEEYKKMEEKKKEDKKKIDFKKYMVISDKKSENKTEEINSKENSDIRCVIMMDGGYTSTSVTVIRYKKNQCEILYHNIDTTLGTRIIDVILIDYLSLIIKQRFNRDPRQYESVYMKMLCMVQKQKTFLQKNEPKVPFSIPNIFQSDTMFSKTISYKEYIDLLIRHKINYRLTKLFGEAIIDSNIDVKDMGYVNVMYTGGLFKCEIYKEFIKLYIKEMLQITRIIEVNIDESEYDNVISEGLCYYNNISRKIVDYEIIDHNCCSTLADKNKFTIRRDENDKLIIPQYEIEKVKTGMKEIYDKILSKHKDVKQLLLEYQTILSKPPYVDNYEELLQTLFNINYSIRKSEIYNRNSREYDVLIERINKMKSDLEEMKSQMVMPPPPLNPTTIQPNATLKQSTFELPKPKREIQHIPVVFPVPLFQNPPKGNKKDTFKIGDTIFIYVGEVWKKGKIIGKNINNTFDVTYFDDILKTVRKINVDYLKHRDK